MSIVLKPSEILEARVHGEAEALQKGKAFPLGTVRQFAGKDYVKTEKGWRQKRKTEGPKGGWTTRKTTKAEYDKMETSEESIKAAVRKQLEEDYGKKSGSFEHFNNMQTRQAKQVHNSFSRPKIELSSEEQEHKKMLGTMQAADDSYHADMAPEELKIVDNLVKKGHAKWTGKGEQKRAEVIEDIEQAKSEVPIFGDPTAAYNAEIRHWVESGLTNKQILDKLSPNRWSPSKADSALDQFRAIIKKTK